MNSFSTIRNEQQPEYQEELAKAILEKDSDALNELLLRNGNDPGIFDDLARQSARVAYQAAGRQSIFGELLFMPIIQKANADDLAQADSLKTAQRTVTGALRKWMPQTKFRLIPWIAPFDLVSCWTLKNTREALHAMVIDPEQKSTAVAASIDLPIGAPRLGFALAATTSDRAWPEIPYTTAMQDTRLRQVVASALALSVGTNAQNAPIVLTPNKVAASMTDGMCVWLEELHQHTPIQGWLINPFTGDLDAMKITLKLDSEEVKWTQFCVRLHQIGAQGLNTLMGYLQETAPNLEGTTADLDGEEILTRAFH
jgi:hypothetical protein